TRDGHPLPLSVDHSVAAATAGERTTGDLPRGRRARHHPSRRRADCRRAGRRRHADSDAVLDRREDHAIGAVAVFAHLEFGLGNVVGLIALAFVPSEPGALLAYVAAFIWIELFGNVATAPYSALIPDVVPKEQRGSASGWLGLMLMLGSFVGGITGLVLPLIG